VRSGQRVLITGAAGGVGHFAVQIARHLGAYVVAVCGPANVEFVRALGADEVVDYTRDDFTRRGDRFDVVFDAAGASSFAASRRVLAADGRYVNTLGDARAFFRDGACRRRGAPDVAPALHRARAAYDAAKAQRLADLAAAGAIRPHVERTIALEEVAEAQRAMETGHGRGKIVVRTA